jgi:hypothetical protein
MSGNGTETGKTITLTAEKTPAAAAAALTWVVKDSDSISGTDSTALTFVSQSGLTAVFKAQDADVGTSTDVWVFVSDTGRSVDSAPGYKVTVEPYSAATWSTLWTWDKADQTTAFTAARNGGTATEKIAGKDGSGTAAPKTVASWNPSGGSSDPTGNTSGIVTGNNARIVIGAAATPATSATTGDPDGEFDLSGYSSVKFTIEYERTGGTADPGLALNLKNTAAGPTGTSKTFAMTGNTSQALVFDFSLTTYSTYLDTSFFQFTTGSSTAGIVHSILIEVQ